MPEDQNIEESEQAGTPGSPEQIIEQPQTENMEVHHHPDLHHKPKHWKEYLLEYIMIFLAVTTGFFAESLREHLSDRSKEREYIVSLNKDLTNDTANMRTWIHGFNARINDYDTLINMLRNPSKVTDGADFYYRARLSTRGTVFDDNNSTMVQLNSSGNFRLISIKSVADKIVNYENDIDNYKNINGYDVFEARALYEPESKLFDAFIFNDMSRPITDSTLKGTDALLVGFRNVFRKPAGNPQLLSQDKEKINDFVYYLHQRRSTFAGEILILYKQKQDAAALITLINKEYNLDNE